MAKRTIRITLELELSDLEGDELVEAKAGTAEDEESELYDEEFASEMDAMPGELDNPTPTPVAEQIVSALQEDPEIWAGSGMFLKIGMTRLVSSEWVGEKVELSVGG